MNCQSNIATVTRQHIMTPPAATVMQHRKTAPTLSVNEGKQKTSKATSRSDRRPPESVEAAGLSRRGLNLDGVRRAICRGWSRCSRAVSTVPE